MEAYAKKGTLVMIFGLLGIANIIFITQSRGLIKLLAVMLLFTILIPSIIKVYSFFIIPEKPKKEYKQQYQSNSYNAKQEVQNVIANAEAKKKYKKAKDNQQEGYAEVKNVLIACSKNKLFSREDVLKIKDEINYMLGDNLKHYNNFIFENDMHEIYIKIKNKHLSTSNYNDLLESINLITQEKEGA